MKCFKLQSAKSSVIIATLTRPPYFVSSCQVGNKVTVAIENTTILLFDKLKDNYKHYFINSPFYLKCIKIYLMTYKNCRWNKRKLHCSLPDSHLSLFKKKKKEKETVILYRHALSFFFCIKLKTISFCFIVKNMQLFFHPLFNLFLYVFT